MTMALAQWFRDKNELIKEIFKLRKELQRVEGLLNARLWWRIYELDQEKVYVLKLQGHSNDMVDDTLRQIQKIKRVFPYTMPEIIVTNSEVEENEKKCGASS